MMQRARRRERCGGNRERGKKRDRKERKKERKATSSAIAKHPIHSSTATRKKRVDWFKGQNARTWVWRRRRRGVLQKC